MDNQAVHIRLADSGDDDFIPGLVERFVGFRAAASGAARRDRRRHPPGSCPAPARPAGRSFLFVAEDDDGQRVGFLHLQTTTDFFTGASNCHISDLAVATGHDGRAWAAP